ncbi:MAG: FecR domain-containing protein [Tannerellaceae bacterium]|jgi:ferric-dicitrate binding protein FerR (iron transport regulator)|nr:FecR domain-containing protein [Tannerellaceae bacterium]
MEREDCIRLFEKYLDKQAKPEDVKRLMEGLSADPMFHAWVDEQWEQAPAEMDEALQKEIRRRIAAQMSPDRQQRASAAVKLSFLQWMQRSAAVWVLLLATGAALYFYTAARPETPDTVVSVGKGQKAHISLPDGTKVWLNSDTELRYGSHFNKTQRMLELEGEAYFEVAPDKDRAFIVQTGGLSVKALGTAFDLKSYADEAQVSTVLISGKVEVASGHEKIYLSPNERLLFDKASRRMEKSAVFEAQDYANWKYDTLSFEAETFENIVRTLERYYNIRICFESESLKRYRFTGTPGNTSLESILQRLSLTSPLSYEVRDSLIVLRENTKQKAYYERAIK